MRKQQGRRELGKVMSSPLMMHMLQVPISHGNRVTTSPAARGTVLAINSTFEAEGGQAPSSIEL
jgi:hypothetical protein